MKHLDLIIRWLVIIALLFFAGHRFFFFKSGNFEKISSCVLYPFLWIYQGTVDPLNQFFKNRKTLSQVRHELQEMHRAYDDLQAENIMLQSQGFYEQEIEELISFKKRYEYGRMLCAHIIFRIISSEEQMIFVDKGSVAGITKDMVAVYKNCLIGRVAEVYPYYCKVFLITDKRCQISSFCAATKTKGIYEGCNRTDKAFLQFVEHFQKLEKDELLLSNGEGLIFPQGFGLGKIKNFNKQKHELYYSVEVEPLVDLENLSYCFLLQKGNY